MDWGRFEVLEAALRKRGGDRCPVCRKRDPAIAVNPTFIPIAGVTPIGSDDPDPPEGVEAIVVTCTNCGLIRLHGTLELLDDG